MLDSLGKRRAGRIVSASGRDGRIKMLLTQRCCDFGASIRRCFARELSAAQLSPARSPNCCVAFAREHEGKWIVGHRAAAFFARRVSADRRGVAGYGGGIADVALAEERVDLFTGANCRRRSLAVI